MANEIKMKTILILVYHLHTIRGENFPQKHLVSYVYLKIHDYFRKHESNHLLQFFSLMN